MLKNIINTLPEEYDTIHVVRKDNYKMDMPRIKKECKNRNINVVGNDYS